MVCDCSLLLPFLVLRLGRSIGLLATVGDPRKVDEDCSNVRDLPGRALTMASSKSYRMNGLLLMGTSWTRSLKLFGLSTACPAKVSRFLWGGQHPSPPEHADLRACRNLVSNEIDSSEHHLDKTRIRPDVLRPKYGTQV